MAKHDDLSLETKKIDAGVTRTLTPSILGGTMP